MCTFIICEINTYVSFIYIRIYILKHIIFMLFVHLFINYFNTKGRSNINLTQNVQIQLHRVKLILGYVKNSTQKF